MIKIKNLKQTCYACPSQWEAETVDSKPVYIRYRWGYLSFRIGQTGQELVSEYEEVFGIQFGDGLDGFLTTGDMLNILKHYLII
jgi:hypothetical protein